MSGTAVRLEFDRTRRSLTAGNRTCFRARALDANRCEVPLPQGTTLVWQIARSAGAAGPNDATIDQGCVRAPPGSPVAEYVVTATAGALTARAVAAVVSAEELQSLLAQHIEEADDAGLPAPATTVSGAGVGAIVVHQPSAPPAHEAGPSALIWALVSLGALVAAGSVALLVRRSHTVPKTDSQQSMARDVLPSQADPSKGSRHPRHDAVVLAAPDQVQAAHPSGSSVAAEPTPTQATPSSDQATVLVKRCPTCQMHFGAEMAFCPEHGDALMATDALTAAPTQPARPASAASGPVRIALAPICPRCGKAVEGGQRYCPNDGTDVAPDALPLSCPTCGKRFGLGTAFCGEDGTRLVAG